MNRVMEEGTPLYRATVSSMLTYIGAPAGDANERRPVPASLAYLGVVIPRLPTLLYVFL